MFVFSFGVLSATRKEHGHSRTRFSDPAFDWAIGLRSYKNSLRQSPLRATTDRSQNLQNSATRWTTRNIAIKPIARNQFRPAQRDAANDAMSVGTKEICPISTPKRISCLTNL
ncbi:MAG: hypothetical protein DME54_06090 [Verrucomicrobia bacterium]|nr:MAG: hypothetical protein DME54_06090 [Verrucomicrobiota bacterium]